MTATLTPTDRRASDAAPAPGPTRPPSSWHQLRTLAGAQMRSFFRDRTSLFFTIFFPLLFLVVFGLLFGNSGTSRLEVGVVGNGALVRALPGEVLDVHHFATLDAALAKVRSGDLPAVVAQQGDTVVVRYAASDRVASAGISSVVGSVVAQANIAATGQPPRFHADMQQVEAQDTKPIQYITPGILSWGVAASAVFGAALTLVSWRRKQLLRRVRLAPAPVWTVVGARVGVSLLVAGLQAVLYVGLALTPPFGLQLSGSWWLAFPLLLAGTLAFLSIGLLVGAVAKTEEASSAIANAVILPMAFLSGTFFPVSQMPGWLQSLSEVFPLRHLNDGMLDVLVRGKGVGALVVPTAVLLGFAIALTFVATRVFSWDDT